MNDVPAGAAPLLALIRRTETGVADINDQYRTIIAHKEGQLSKPITAMTLDELVAEQKRWVRNWKVASGAAGAYQIIRATLTGLIKELGLPGSTRYTPEVQDRMAVALLKRRGFPAFMAGTLSETAFGNNLAKEWASFPVFSAIKGAKRPKLKVGQSYYDGDNINHALVSVASVRQALTAAKSAPVPSEPTAPDFPKKGARDNAIVMAIQSRLKDLGYTEVGNADGTFGDMTEKAILIFRHDAKLPLIPVIDKALNDALLVAKPRTLAESRTEASPGEVREKVPEARDTWWSKVVAFWTMVTTGFFGFVSFIVENIPGAKGLVKPVTDIAGKVPLWGWAVLLGAGLLTIWLKNKSSEKKTVVAYQEGARR